MNTINDKSIINTYGVSNENIVIASSAKTENKVGLDDTAAILNLSEEAFGDGVVTVKSSGTRAMSSTEIITAQNCLRTLGFYSGSNTGYVSSEMQSSIANFQKVYGMSVTGELSSNIYNKIVEVNNFYNATMNDADISSLKNSLFNDSGISASLKTTLTKNLALTWTFLRKGMGLTEKQAAGAMGNIMQESYFSPNNAQDTPYPGIQNPEYAYRTNDSVAYGLIQWKDESRKTNLAKVANGMELSVGDINAQFACIRDESRNPYFCLSGWNSLTSSSTVEAATQIFKEQIEICGDNTLSIRTNYANIIYNALRTG